MISEQGMGDISMLFVQPNYHRQGIGTILMEKMVKELKLGGYNRITLNSSPYTISFYHMFGFKDLDTQQEKDGFMFTPMEIIN